MYIIYISQRNIHWSTFYEHLSTTQGCHTLWSYCPIAHILNISQLEHISDTDYYISKIISHINSTHCGVIVRLHLFYTLVKYNILVIDIICLCKIISHINSTHCRVVVRMHSFYTLVN